MRILSPAMIGCIAHFATQLLFKTLRIQVVIHPNVEAAHQYMYGFWHGKQLTPIMLMANAGRRAAGLVSASRDGEILSTWLTRLGYHIVRGSSSRRSTSSLVKLITIAKKGYSVGIAADGPRGPRHEAKSGLAFLAYKAKLSIVPIGVAYSSKWQFNKAWDKYQLPLPFSKIVLYLGEPLKVLDINDQQTVNAEITQAIKAAEMNAELILQGQSQAVAENIVKISH